MSDNQIKTKGNYISCLTYEDGNKMEISPMDDM